MKQQKKLVQVLAMGLVLVGVSLAYAADPTTNSVVSTNSVSPEKPNKDDAKPHKMGHKKHHGHKHHGDNKDKADEAK